MTKESIYELQRVDCNCNDCGFLVRQLDRQNEVLVERKTTDEEIYYAVKEKKAKDIQETINSLTDHRAIIKDADRKIDKLKNKLKVLLSEKYGYQGQKTPIQYGSCLKFNKEVTFIPNTLQIETQKCFIHRKDYQHQ